jgi:hypothetical protein
MGLFESGRWPSIYDAESLKKALDSVIDSEIGITKNFYQQHALFDGVPCQGDIIELSCAAPYIDEDGQPIATDVEYRHWIILGNSCDFSRVEEERSLVAPLVDIQQPLEETQWRALRRYEYYKQFYVPPWPGDTGQNHHLADFLQLVTIHKKAFETGKAKVVARLQFPGWALLHAFIVRYLARDDGRFD